jgi:Holliday junction resolvasome RuvABC endonuclease subunit
MRKILGVDIGSKALGLAHLVVENGGSLNLELVLIATATIKPVAGWPLERRLAHIDDELAHRLQLPEHGGWSADLMACEAPWPIVGRKAAFEALCRTIGHVECAANRFGMEFRLVQACDWRRTNGVRGRGRAELKRAARRAAKMLFGRDLPEDEAEAALIARHAALTIK